MAPRVAPGGRRGRGGHAGRARAHRPDRPAAGGALARARPHHRPLARADRGELGAAHVWAPARGVRRLKNRGVVVTDAFEKDPELPGGIKALPCAREGEVLYWLPQQKALVVGDVLLGAGAKPHATSEPLRLCPESWLDGATTKQLVRSLLPILELPVERILVSHGDPVLQGGKDVLKALIAPDKA